MCRLITFLTIAGTVSLIGCNRTWKEAGMERAPDLSQAINALRGAYAAFNRGDMESAVQPLDLQIEWTEPAEFPGGGTYHGREAVKGYLTQSRAAWAEGSSEPERFIVFGNRIVVFVHARFRLKNSQQWGDMSLADVYTIRDGIAVQMRAFADRKEALNWAGVEEPSRGATRSLPPR
jgi:ketosteroid isomerase-like protein